MNSHEYGENYITIPMAERMIADDPDIANDWSKFLEQNGPLKSNDYQTIVDWFFKITTFYDHEAYLLDIGVVMDGDQNFMDRLDAISVEMEISSEDVVDHATSSSGAAAAPLIASSPGALFATVGFIVAAALAITL
jgi:hypothetical protein